MHYRARVLFRYSKIIQAGCVAPRSMIRSPPVRNVEVDASHRWEGCPSLVPKCLFRSEAPLAVPGASTCSGKSLLCSAPLLFRRPFCPGTPLTASPASQQTSSRPLLSTGPCKLSSVPRSGFLPRGSLNGLGVTVPASRSNGPNISKQRARSWHSSLAFPHFPSFPGSAASFPVIQAGKTWQFVPKVRVTRICQSLWIVLTIPPMPILPSEGAHPVLGLPCPLGWRSVRCAAADLQAR